MKKIFTLILFCMIAFNTIHAEINWYLSNDGTLTISGTDMPNYEYGGTPWYSRLDEIKKVIIENGVTNIGNWAFCDCNLTSVTIPNSVTSIGSSVFYDCHLTSVKIPNSVTSIGAEAFCDCLGFTSINIPNSVRTIGFNAFNGCYNLASITIPNSVTSIGFGAFDNTKWYENQPNGLIYLGKVLYKYKGAMSEYTKIKVKEGTVQIGGAAFASCSGLYSVIIPNSVTSIANNAFSGCSNLTFITVEEGNSVFDNRNNCNAIIDTKSNTLIIGCKNTTIPESVTGIGMNAFRNCYSLPSITIPNSVTNIGDNAFHYCTGLKSITIPNSVTSIGMNAFYDCTSLTSITCEANTPPDCGNYCFNYINIFIPIYVPANSVAEYKVANQWQNFKNIQEIPRIYLTDGTLCSNNSQLNGRDISYTRTFNNTAWQALYIPFSLNYNDWKDNFEIAYINGVRQLDKDDNGTIDETIMDVIKIKSGSTSPNMPYLIKAKKTGENTFSVSNATLYPAEENSVDCSTTIAKYTFTGTYNTISSATMIANNYYGMGGGELVQSDGSNDLMPYRWYMNVESRNPSYNASNAAKTITINVLDEEGETTGVEELRMANDESPVYDLNGRKVNENNLKPGIYVKNGKKFVVK